MKSHKSSADQVLHTLCVKLRTAQPSQKIGFSLVELLVVVAIIGILVALLFPAVQSAREAARMIQCANNLKQLGLAMNSYHSVHSQYPPGFINDFVHDCGATTVGRNGICTWNPPELPYMVHLFPYLEASELYDLIDFDYAWYDHKWPDEVVGTILSVLTCPSDGLGQLMQAGDFLRVRVPAGVHGNRYASAPMLSKSNYLAFFTGRRFDELEHEMPPDLVDYFLPSPADLHTYRAAFGINRGASIRQITDGTSHTMLMGEYITGIDFAGLTDRRGNKIRDARGTFWFFRPGGGALTTKLTPNSSARDLLTEPVNSVWCSRETNVEGMPCAESTFCSPHSGDGHATARSHHIGVVQIVLADGSVHRIDDAIDLGTWRAYATIAGAE